MSDWLDIEPEASPDKAGLPVVVDVPIDMAARLQLIEECWDRLSPRQKLFLAAYRECGFNSRKAERKLRNSPSRSSHKKWAHDPDYATVIRLWRGAAAADALDKDRLLVRQDDIVETLLTPKPVLYQGIAVFDPKRPGEILEEVEAGAASRANEVLMKAAGMLKDKDIEINVGLIGPSLNIQVVQQDGRVQELTQDGVAVELDEPIDAEWAEIAADGA